MGTTSTTGITTAVTSSSNTSTTGRRIVASTATATTTTRKRRRQQLLLLLSYENNPTVNNSTHCDCIYSAFTDRLVNSGSSSCNSCSTCSSTSSNTTTTTIRSRGNGTTRTTPTPSTTRRTRAVQAVALAVAVLVLVNLSMRTFTTATATATKTLSNSNMIRFGTSSAAFMYHSKRTTIATMRQRQKRLQQQQQLSCLCYKSKNNNNNNKRGFFCRDPPSTICSMSLDSRELRFYHSPAYRNDNNNNNRQPSTSGSTIATSVMEKSRENDNTSIGSNTNSNVVLSNYLSHIFPSSILSSQYKLIESNISPFILSAMTAVATAIMTSNLTLATTTTTVVSNRTAIQQQQQQHSLHCIEPLTSAVVTADAPIDTTTQLKVEQQQQQQQQDGGQDDNKNQRSRSSAKRVVPSPSSQLRRQRPPQSGYGASIQLTDSEKELFTLLRHVRNEIGLSTTLRVAGGWVRDKLLATPEFQTYHKIFTVGYQDTMSSSSYDPSTKTQRISSKFRRQRYINQSNQYNYNNPSSGRQGTKILISNNKNSGINSNSNGVAVTQQFQPVDIDIALDDMLGREFADHLNDYLSKNGQDTVTVGMVLKNPDKSKHLETATMKVGSFWIDFVNLRAEEYTQDSRIPDLMRIGTAHEDAYRRDLTINSLFYNINTGQIEDWTGRGFQDLRKGVVSTPLHPLTTLLDDPLRVLRSIRFAARLRFTMDDELVKAAQMSSVADALSQKVSRERIGGELDLMLRSPDPVGAIRLLINLKQVQCVFPVAEYYKEIIVQQLQRKDIPNEQLDRAIVHAMGNVFRAGLLLLSTAHDHLADCLWSPPIWCVRQKRIYGVTEVRLIDDEEGRRLLWYASFLKPMYDEFKRISPTDTETKTSSRRSSAKHRSIVMKILVDELKRPIRDAESIERIIKTADEFTRLMESGMDISATMILLSSVSVSYTSNNSESDQGNASNDFENKNNSFCSGQFICTMNGRTIDSNIEDDPVWQHAMEFRLACAKVLQPIGALWRAALFLAISEELVKVEQENNGGIEYTIVGDILHETQEERRQGIMERYDTFATALQQIGLIGIWDEKPIADGDTIKQSILPGLPKGPMFRDVMEEQWKFMIQHPGANIHTLTNHLQTIFAPYVSPDTTTAAISSTETKPNLQQKKK